MKPGFDRADSELPEERITGCNVSRSIPCKAFMTRGTYVEISECFRELVGMTG